MKEITIDVGPNDLEVWTNCYSAPVRLRLSRNAADAISASRKAIEKIISSGKPVYGINTGFGALSNQPIALKTLLNFRIIWSVVSL